MSSIKPCNSCSFTPVSERVLDGEVHKWVKVCANPSCIEKPKTHPFFTLGAAAEAWNNREFQTDKEV